ncbi:MAG TPA: LamG-like jellyroll fold domain-containing protein [Solirubrobacterales bacterium]|nr:LamG-like jellyroll fold domain-containing protein [Solirubrobacterales bacterium]
MINGASSKTRGSASGSRRERVHFVGVAALLLLLLTGVASAIADAPEGASYSRPEISEEAAAEAADSEDIRAQLTEPEIAESLPHSDLSREGAIELIEGVFPLELESPAGIFDELQVEKFYSDHVALVSGDDAPEPGGVIVGEESSDQYEGPTLLESSVPLRTEGEDGTQEAIDLSLEHTEGELQPANSAAELAIPGDLSEGIELGASGVEISLGEAPEGRSPSVVDGSVAFYPNVAEDSDFAVAPTPTGVETFTTLRSPDAPNSIEYDLGLPVGMSLREDGGGGAEVVNAAGDLKVVVQAPSAIDAQGREVATTMRVQGDSLQLEVAPDQSTAYPVLVDPEYEFFLWYEENTTAGTEAFKTESTAPAMKTGVNWSASMPNPSISLNSYGLYVQAPQYTSFAAETGAVWVYSVPRLKSDEEKYGAPPTSYIASMDLSKVGFFDEANYGVLHFVGGTEDPRYWSGIWDGFNSKWASAWTHTGTEGQVTNLNAWYHYPGNNDHNAKIAEPVGLWSLTASKTAAYVPREAYVGTVILRLADPDPPHFGSISSPPWTNGEEGSLPLKFSVSDTGLGVQAVIPYDSIPAAHHSVNMHCAGAVNPCPRVVTSSELGSEDATIDPSKLPSGITKMYLAAYDPLLNWGYTTFYAKVDRSAPEATLSGPLSATGGKVKPKDYALSVSAKDGTEAAPQSGVGSVEFKLDGAQVKRVTCEKQNCELNPEWVLHTSAYGVGQHTAEVIVTDRVGRSVKREQKFTIEKDTTAPAITTLAKATGSYPSDTYPVQTNVSDSGSGLAKLELLVDGKRSGVPVTNACADVEEDEEEGHCFTKAASSAQVFSVNMAEYSPGSHALELIATDGAGNVATKQGSMSVETGVGAAHVAPTLTLSGTMTEQATLGTTRPRYVLKAEAGAGNEFEPSGAAPTYASAFGSSGTGNGQLVHPADLARDSAGNLWVADAGNNRIEEFNSKGEYVAKFGSSGSGNGQFNRPSALAVNAKGNIVVADSGNARVQVFNSKGEFVKAFGSAGTGNGQFTAPGPEGIAVDAKGNVWVADTYGRRLEKFTEGGEFVKAVGAKGSGSGQLGEPVGIDVAADGSVFVADWQNNRVAVFGEGGEFLRQFGSEGIGNGQFKHPGAITVDSRGKVWVADQENGRVEQFSSTGEYLAQFGAKGSGSGQFGYPSAIALDTEGHLWVADAAGKEMRTPAAPSNGPTAAYGLDEGSGSTAKDSAGSHTGTVTSSSWVEGKYGKALSFNGESSCVSVPNSVDLQLAGSFTLEAWVKPANTSQWAPIFFKEAESFYSYSLFFGAFEAGHVQGYVADKPWEWTEVESPAKLTANTWSHVAMTSDGTTLRLYVNGTQVDTGSAKAAMESKQPLLIGCAKNFGEYFNGQIDNIRIYNRALTAAEVETSKSTAISSSPPLSTTPTAAWAFDEGSGTSTKDLAGSHTGTLSSASWVEGKYGKAISFNGSSSCVSVPNSADLQLSGPFSLEAWVRPANTSQWAPIFFKETESFYGYSLFFGAFSSGYIQGYTANKTNEWTEVESPEKLTANAWSHVAMTSDDATLRLYINGKQVDSTAAGPVMESKGPLLIGCSKLWGEYFNGQIDNARIYNRTLSVAEVEANKASPVAAEGDRIQAWTQPATNGIASTEITLDGKAVDSSPAGCSTANCTLAREWTLSSPSNLGSHSVLVKATSKGGTTTTKTLAIEVKADNSKPTLASSGALLEAPEGWVEQKKYALTASATDPSGSGVKSLVFKVDGVPAESVTKTCPDGACQASLAQPINMADYRGGSHTAELVATDGVGNVVSKKWTLNVDPKGVIGEGETKAMLEAAEETSGVNVIGPSEEEEVEGTASGLEFEEGPDGIEATGTATPVAISSGGKEEPCTVALQAVPAESFGGVAESEGEGSVEEPEETTEVEEALEEASENPGAEVSFIPQGEPVEISQGGIGPETCAPALANDVAAVEANTAKQVDTVIRPLYDGAMMFQTIRGPGAPESYSWDVELADDQKLQSIDSHNATVFYEDGTPAMAITADPAHDATGAEVPTTLSVTEGGVVTLTVHYGSGNAEGKPFTYPILAGAGYEVGTEEVTIYYPPEAPSSEGEEEGEAVSSANGAWRIRSAALGPPTFSSSSGGGAPTRSRAYRFNSCAEHISGTHVEGNGPPPQLPRFEPNGTSRQCHSEGTGFGEWVIDWAVVIYGKFSYKWGEESWISKAPECNEWGERVWKGLIWRKGCYVFKNKWKAEFPDKVNVLGDWRFGTAAYEGGIAQGGQEVCLELNGVLPSRPQLSENGERVYQDNYHERYEPIGYGGNQCPWEHLGIRAH